MALRHEEGCPKTKGRTESGVRRFQRKGNIMEAKVSRCLDCGARDTTKPKVVDA